MDIAQETRLQDIYIYQYISTDGTLDEAGALIRAHGHSKGNKTSRYIYIYQYISTDGTLDEARALIRAHGHSKGNKTSRYIYISVYIN